MKLIVPEIEAKGLRMMTLEEFHNLLETGIGKRGECAELLNGSVIQTVTNGSCEECVPKVFDILTREVSSSLFGEWTVSSARYVSLGQYTALKPSIVVLRGRCQEDQDGFAFQGKDVALVVEFAEAASLEHIQRKITAYVKACIPEVWVIHVQQQSVFVYSKPFVTVYFKMTIAGVREQCISHTLSDLSFYVKEIFER